MARRLNIAAALQKVVKRQYLDAAGLKSLETIALSLERDGDVEGAVLVREIVQTTSDKQGQWTVPHNATRGDSMQWHVPTSFKETLVLDGETRVALDELARDLALTPRFLAAGIDAPTRVIFIGTSGVGKTLAARWLGWRLGLPVAIMQIDATVDSYLGATAKKVRQNIEGALATPSILFLDEIEAICGQRGNSDGTAAHQEVARTTSALLQQLDALPPSQIVIAATNLPEQLDFALRRRLPTEIVFGLPTRQARSEMLHHWLARTGIAESVLEELAEGSDGLSGAALRARAMKLGREAIRATAHDVKPVTKGDVDAVGA